MDIIIGSARHNENHAYHGGKPGDQLQNGSGEDFSGEVSMQDFYVHKKGWVILRAKSAEVAAKLAEAMRTACNNSNIGYNQDQRDQVIAAGVKTTKKVNADCSSLVRACVIYATGKDPGDFTTSDEADTLVETGLFERINYSSKTELYAGDILVTKTKGHTVIVIKSPYKRPSGRPVIKKGYKDSEKGGDYCAELQEDLNKLGYRDQDGKKLVIDGSCGGRTVAAIKNLQRENGLEVDGHCGPKTWAKIDELLADPPIKRVRTTTEVYLRFGPGIDYGARRILPEGGEYIQTAESKGWAYLAEPEAGGWVSVKFLETV